MSLRPLTLERAPAATVIGPAAYRIERGLGVLHSLNYRYAAPVRDVSTRLRLLPPPVRGAQRLLGSGVRVAPQPFLSRPDIDPFGNALLDLRHEEVRRNLTLVFEMQVATGAAYDAEGHVLPGLLPPAEGAPPEGTDAFLQFTPLTTPTPALESVAADVASQAPEDPATRARALCEVFCRRVYHEMRYTPGSTTVQTPAGEAWATGRGVCQDYAHVFLSLCRLVGLPARYVSGFLPGEGAMHAWAEILLPENGESAGGWAALDPTHDRWVNERYVAVAVGRDYRDITPTSGTFVGKGPGPLSHRSKVEVVQTTRIDL